MVRVPRIELGSGRWQRPVLPLNYTRIKALNKLQNRIGQNSSINTVLEQGLGIIQLLALATLV